MAPRAFFLCALVALAAAQCARPGESLAIFVTPGNPNTCLAPRTDIHGDLLAGHNVTRSAYANFTGVNAGWNVTVGQKDTVNDSTILSGVLAGMQVNIDRTFAVTALGSIACNITGSPGSFGPFPSHTNLVVLAASNVAQVLDSHFVAVLASQSTTITECLFCVLLGAAETIVDGSMSTELVISGSGMHVSNSVHKLATFGGSHTISTLPYPQWDVTVLDTYEIRYIFLSGNSHTVSILGNDTATRIDHTAIMAGHLNSILLRNGKMDHCNIYCGNYNDIDMSAPASLTGRCEHHVIAAGIHNKIRAAAAATVCPDHGYILGGSYHVMETASTTLMSHNFIGHGTNHYMYAGQSGTLLYTAIFSGRYHEMFVSASGAAPSISTSAIVAGYRNSMRVVGPTNYLDDSVIVAGRYNNMQVDTGSAVTYRGNAILAGVFGNLTNSQLSVILTGENVRMDGATQCVVINGVATQCTHDYAVMMNGAVSQNTGEFRNPGACHCGTFGLPDGGSITAGTNGGAGITIGTNATQKMAFWGATPPVVQPAPSGTSTTPASGGSTAGFREDKYTGGVGSTAYSLPDVIAAMKASGLLAL